MSWLGGSGQSSVHRQDSRHRHPFRAPRPVGVGSNKPRSEAISAVQKKRPQQDSNLRTRLRRPLSGRANCAAYLAVFARCKRSEARSFRLCSGSWLNQRYGRSSDGMLLVSRRAEAIRQPEKPKVGSSTLSLTTTVRHVPEAMARLNTTLRYNTGGSLSYRQVPLVSVVCQVLSRGDRTGLSRQRRLAARCRSHAPRAVFTAEVSSAPA